MTFPPVFIQGISTAVPEFEYKQDELCDFMVRVMGDTERRRSFIQKVYAGSSIEKRYSVLEDYKLPPSERTFFPKTENMEPQPSTAARNALFCVEANNLASLVVRRLFDQFVKFPASSVTHLITVSCTGFSAPGFDHHLVREFDLDSGIHRFHIGFMGCFAAFPALKLAQSLCRSTPGARVLIVDVELCSLHFQKVFEPDIVVANALFSDGAAALLVSSDEAFDKEDGSSSRLLLHDFSSHIIPGSEDDMAWIIGEHGFDMKLSSYVPRLIESNIKTILENLFLKSGWNVEELRYWAIHPGGRAILDKTAQVLALKEGELGVSYDVLRNFGNMSSATIFFVLESLLRSAKPKDGGKLFSCAFGPGLTVESAVMELTTGQV